MPWLLENDTRHTFEELKTHVAESSATRFCNEWLTGKTDFQLQTSGSTGIPKQICATREQLKASARITAHYLNLKPEQTALVCLDITFIAGRMMLVRALEVGMNIIVTPPEANPLQVLADEIPVDFAALVPYQVEAILKSPQRKKLNTITNVIIGGAPLPAQTKVELKAFTNNTYATYGMTETLTHIAMQKLSGHTEDTFHVLPGFKIEKDDRGCLSIQAAHLGSEPIVTNDLVELIGNDQFKWLGRIDGVINTGGIKIIPEKIESVIALSFKNLQIPNRFIIAGLPHAQLGESVALIIEGTITKAQTESLKQTLGQTLTRYENPKSFYLVDRFVETRTGKINRPQTISLVLETSVKN
ncbi:MAG TPA: AMP-binding protein [Cyclobacteriaceae bacterium]|nr:AMP-binding protein [Cyclobacteriaceae bacterium]